MRAARSCDREQPRSNRTNADSPGRVYPVPNYMIRETNDSGYLIASMRFVNSHRESPDNRKFKESNYFTFLI